MPEVWVARVVVSDRTRAKVAAKHGLDVELLLAHLVGVRGLPFRWDEHPDRGRRVVVSLTLGRRQVAVVLYPAPDLGEDCFRLGSAYPV